MTHTGGCQCGGIRYEVSGDLGDIYVCHCTDCQAQSSSAFGISVGVRLEDLNVTNGTPSTYSWVGGGGAAKRGAFCPDCGTRLWHLSGDDDESPSIKGGTFDQPVDLTNAIHIWTASKLPGVIVPETCQQFPGEPEEA